jgi:hypothetical protein
MSEIVLNLDMGPLIDRLDQMKDSIQKDVERGVGALAKSTHEHIKKQAQNKLHSFREGYLENLMDAEQLDKNLWVITLNKDAAWIELGIPQPYSMKPGLLDNKKAKGPIKSQVGKDGKKYRIIPMNQGKVPSELSRNNSGYEQNMINLVKSELRKRDIPYKKLELDKNGSPRTGKLHTLDIDSHTPGKGNTPQLQGINIYQTANKKTGKIERNITTFRTVKEGEDGKWIHPAVEASNFFKDAKTWAETEWETKILPMILDKNK